MHNTRIIDILVTYCRQNASRFSLEQVFLYGSRAQQAERPDSDIDIAILFTDDVADDVIFERTAEISLELTRLIGLEVNVLQLTSDFRHPMLYYNAIVHGVPVFVLDPDQYIALKLEALREMEDFSLFGTGWQIAAARRNLEVSTHA